MTSFNFLVLSSPRNMLSINNICFKLVGSKMKNCVGPSLDQWLRTVNCVCVVLMPGAAQSRVIQEPLYREKFINKFLKRNNLLKAVRPQSVVLFQILLVSTVQDSFDVINFINLSLINSMTNSFCINTSLSQIVPLRPKDQEYILPP